MIKQTVDISCVSDKPVFERLPFQNAQYFSRFS